MKLNLRQRTFVLAGWLWVLCGGLAQAQTEPAPAAAGALPGLLIVEVSEQDGEPAARLSSLLELPVQRIRSPAAREPRSALPLLRDSGASQLVVLDTARQRCHVLERDGRLRTRVVEGEPTPYLMAFVASELLALDGPPASAPARVGRIARVAGALTLDVSSLYRDKPQYRPKLGLDLWWKNSTSRLLPLTGLELAGPGTAHTRSTEQGELSVERWDLLLRVGLARPFGRLRVLAFAQARLGFNNARYAGALGVSQQTVSLGMGVGSALELGLNDWLALYAGLSVDYLPRRNVYEVQGEPLLRERRFMLAGSLGLMLTSRLGP